MKKVLIFIIGILMFISCDKMKEIDGETQVNYTIVYPDTIITKDSVFKYTYYLRKDFDRRIPATSSFRGSNYIYLGSGYTFESTTCPIRINSYKIIK